MRGRVAVASAVACAALAAGCGNPTLRPYGNVDATSKCLRAGRYKARTHLNDFIASTASRGALRASRKHNTVTILFGDDARDAADLRRAYRRFMPKRRARHIMEFTEIERNALLLWTTTPSDKQLAVVVGCLH